MAKDAPPPISPIWLSGFRTTARWLFKRHFRALRVHLEHQLPSPDRPLVIYANHPGWWDPIIATLLAREWYPQHRHYFPMDAAPLRRQFGFGKIGFLPVARDKPAGTKRFLKWGRQLVKDPSARLWITPQGLLTDPRVRPVNVLPGIAKITCENTLMLPLAIEYCFWEHKKPEALVLVGKAHLAGPDPVTLCQTNVLHCLDSLSMLAQLRKPSDFRTVLSSCN